MTSEGKKYDGDKPRFDLLWDGMPNALLGVVKVLTFGAKKYSDHSWQNVPDAIRRYSAAKLRHDNAIARGETHDAESGLPHEFHSACNALFLAELRERKRILGPDRSGAGHGEPGQGADPVQGSDGGADAGVSATPVQDGTSGLRRAPDLIELAGGAVAVVYSCEIHGQHTPMYENGKFICQHCRKTV